MSSEERIFIASELVFVFFDTRRPDAAAHGSNENSLGFAALSHWRGQHQAEMEENTAKIFNMLEEANNFEGLYQFGIKQFI